MSRTDITDREDLRRLIVEFYTRAFADELLGHVFVDIAKMDLTAHLPTMVDFWGTVLLCDGTYRGGAFRPHAELHEQVALTPQHFWRWTAIWEATVDHMFEGPIANTAKDRAQSIAAAFQRRLQQPELGAMYAYRRTAPHVCPVKRHPAPTDATP